MKIGILGSGDVGKALARGFMAEGYDVVIATRDKDSDKAKQLASDLQVAVGDFAETAAFGEIVVLCTKWDGTKNALDLAGQENLTGKVLIDTTNPLDFSEGFPPFLALGRTDSGGEQIQRWLPDTKVVKAFNIVGNQHMHKPDFPGGPPTMMIAGDDEEAKQPVKTILKSFGWETVDIGDISGSRELESLCILWVKYGRAKGTYDHAFKVLEK